MKKNHLWGFFLILIFSACHSQDGYKIGDEFKITLEKEGMGGYAWKMQPDSLVTIVKEYNEARLNDTTKLNEYKKIFELKASKKGIT